MPAHLRGWWLAGLFFAGISAAEFCLGFLVLSVTLRWLWLLAVGISIATMAVWAFSRIWGMPVGPRAWQPEAVGWPDYISTVLEAMTAGGFLALAYPVPRGGAPPLPGPCGGRDGARGRPDQHRALVAPPPQRRAFRIHGHARGSAGSTCRTPVTD
jgi:hypothetical protein